MIYCDIKKMSSLSLFLYDLFWSKNFEKEKGVK